MKKVEEEIKKIQTEPRIGTIEYHIDHLSVESIQNGILDLGVHMGNEIDKKIQTNGEPLQNGTKGSFKDQIQKLEQEMQEVKVKLSTIEEQFSSYERRLQYLEDMHP